MREIRQMNSRTIWKWFFFIFFCLRGTFHRLYMKPLIEYSEKLYTGAKILKTVTADLPPMTFTLPHLHHHIWHAMQLYVDKVAQTVGLKLINLVNDSLIISSANSGNSENNLWALSDNIMVISLSPPPKINAKTNKKEEREKKNKYSTNAISNQHAYKKYCTIHTLIFASKDFFSKLDNENMNILWKPVDWWVLKWQKLFTLYYSHFPLT